MFQQIQPKNKTIPHEIPSKPWNKIGVKLLIIKYSSILWVVAYCNKFQMVKWAEGPSEEHWVRYCKFIFAEYGLLQKISDAGTNFILKNLKEFYSKLNIK